MSRRARALTAVAALAVCVVLGIWAPQALSHGLGTDPGTPLLIPTEPYVLLPLIALIVLLEALQRDWRAVALAACGSAVPVALNTWAVKPLFHHQLHDYLGYPSGHTVSLVSTLTVLVLLARQGISTVITLVAATAVTVAAGAGLVEAGYHYPVDVIGGACFAVAVTLAVSLVVSPAPLPGPRPAPVPSTGSPRAGTSSDSPPASSPR